MIDVQLTDPGLFLLLRDFFSSQVSVQPHSDCWNVIATQEGLSWTIRTVSLQQSHIYFGVALIRLAEVGQHANVLND